MRVEHTDDTLPASSHSATFLHHLFPLQLKAPGTAGMIREEGQREPPTWPGHQHAAHLRVVPLLSPMCSPMQPPDLSVR